MAFTLITLPEKNKLGAFRVSTVQMRKSAPWQLQICIPSAEFHLAFGEADAFDVLLGSEDDAGKMLLRPSEGGGIQATAPEGFCRLPTADHGDAAADCVSRRRSGSQGERPADGDRASRLGLGAGALAADPRCARRRCPAGLSGEAHQAGNARPGRKAQAMSADWTPEEITQLKAFWAEGLSASEIAERMPSRSRNAVLGYVDRHRDDFGKRCKQEERANHSKRVRRAMVRIWGESSERPEPIKRKPAKVAKHRPKGSTRIAAPAPMVMMPTLAEPVETLALPHGWTREGGVHRDLSRFIVPGVEPVRLSRAETGQCRFTLASFGADDGGETLCCGAPVRPGKSWCGDHMKLVWSKRRAKPAVEAGKARPVRAWA